MKKFTALFEALTSGLGGRSRAEKNVPAAPQAQRGQARASLLAQALPGTDKGYYTIEEYGPDRHAVVAYIDYATRRMTPLCAKPGCSHADNSCPACALLPGSGSALLAVAGDRLLVLQTEGEQGAPRLIAAGLDGSDPRTVCELPAGLTVDARVYSDGENLYAMADFVEDGAPVKQLYCIPLDGAEARCLHTFPANTDGMIGSAFDSCLCLDLVQPDPDTGAVQMMLQLYHVDTETLDPPLVSKESNADGGAVLYGATLVEIDTADASRANVRFSDLRTGAVTLYAPAPLFAQTGLTSAWINVLELWDGWYRFTFQSSGQFASYNVNIATGEAVPMDLYYPDSTNVVLVLDRQKGQLLVRAGWDQQWNGSTLQKLTPVYALMREQDYLRSRPEYRYIQGLEE